MGLKSHFSLLSYTLSPSLPFLILFFISHSPSPFSLYPFSHFWNMFLSLFLSLTIFLLSLLLQVGDGARVPTRMRLTPLGSSTRLSHSCLFLSFSRQRRDRVPTRMTTLLLVSFAAPHTSASIHLSLSIFFSDFIFIYFFIIFL